ncbi:Uncharacterised protein [Mycobacteroides abscessus]|nr:Uncharacterised protein [Mycobacteroides abscessus]
MLIILRLFSYYNMLVAIMTMNYSNNIPIRLTNSDKILFVIY